MHTVELLESATELAQRVGYTVRQEWLGGAGGGACQIGGQKVIFIDLALTIVEQLDQVCAALRDDPAIYTAVISAPLRPLLGLRRAA